MNKKLYARGLAGQYFYGASEYLALALTYRPTPKDIEYVKNVRYGKEKNNYMHTYCRKDLKETRKPLLIYVHGGGWVSGLLEMRSPYLYKWAQKGFFASSLNYSFAPQKIFPEAIKELFCAVDHIIDRADEYNIDTENVVIAGESAGGYFISYIIDCINNPQKLKEIGVEFKNADKINIKVMVSHSGAFVFENLMNPEKKQSKYPDMKMMITAFTGKTMKELREFIKTKEGKLLSPEFDGKFPPSFLVWCSRDPLRYETFDLAEKFKELGVAYKTFKGDGAVGNHAWTIVTMFKKARICLDETFDFALPYFPEYFEKGSDGWKFIKK